MTDTATPTSLPLGWPVTSNGVTPVTDLLTRRADARLARLLTPDTTTAVTDADARRVAADAAAVLRQVWQSEPKFLPYPEDLEEATYDND